MTTKISKSLLEAVSEVIYFDNLTEKEKIDHILKEDFNKDVRRYEKYHKEFSGVLTESQIDEGFLDTVKNLGKNALSSVTDAWKKAKQKGDEEEMARLQKKLDKLKTASDSGKKLPDVSSREKVAVMAGQSVIDELEKQDSKTADILKSSSPEKVADALENPNIKRKAEEIKKQIASETPASGESGFLGKVTSWMKKNPVKGAAAVALLSVVVGAAAVGSGGVLPLIGTVIGGAVKGAAVGGIGGSVVGAAKSAIGDKMAGNKFDLKKTAKAGLAGAKTGAKTGAIVGAVGAFAGSAIKGFSSGLKNIMAGKPGEVSASELDKVKTNIDNTVENPDPEDPYAAYDDREIQIIKKLDRVKQGLDSMGISNGKYRSIGTGNRFSITSPEGVTREFSYDKNNKILDIEDL